MTSTHMPHSGIHLRIKLPRHIVRPCKKNKRSDGFSHHGDLEGKEGIIYCTGDHGAITDGCHGVFKRVSNKARQWVLFVERVLHPQELMSLE